MPVDLEFQPSHTLSLVSNGVEIRIPTSFGTTVRDRTKENISITFDVTDPIIETGKCFVRQGGVDFIVLFLPFGRQGTMTVEGTGTVFRTDTGAYDTINTGSALLLYDTRQPELISSDLPTRYEPGDPASADFVVGLNRNVTFDVTDPSNADEVFAFDGPYFGSAPGLYRYTGSGQPRLPLPADLLTATEWSLMHRNDYGQYFAVRFSQVPDTAQGTLNITLKDDVALTPDNEDSLLAVTLPPLVPVPQMQAIPVIERIDTQFLELTADFDVTVNITGGPADTARVRGLAKRSHYDFDETNQTIRIRGNALELLTDQMWTCTASGPGGDAATVNQIYNYVELEPVVSALGKQILIRSASRDILIPISNGPSDGAVTTELIGVEYELVDNDSDGINDHMRIFGNVNASANFSITEGTFNVMGTNTGGDHSAITVFGFAEPLFLLYSNAFYSDNIRAVDRDTQDGETALVSDVSSQTEVNSLAFAYDGEAFYILQSGDVYVYTDDFSNADRTINVGDGGFVAQAMTVDEDYIYIRSFLNFGQDRNRIYRYYKDGSGRHGYFSILSARLYGNIAIYDTDIGVIHNTSSSNQIFWYDKLSTGNPSGRDTYLPSGEFNRYANMAVRGTDLYFHLNNRNVLIFPLPLPSTVLSAPRRFTIDSVAGTPTDIAIY